jgi:hypothetical protein
MRIRHCSSVIYSVVSVAFWSGLFSDFCFVACDLIEE